MSKIKFSEADQKFIKELGRDLNKDLALDVQCLQDTMCDQPSLIAWYGIVYEHLMAQYEKVKLDHDILLAQKDELFRQSETKITEKKIEKMLGGDPEVSKHSIDIIEIKRKLGIMKAIKEAMDSKNQMLIQIASTVRTEMKNLDFNAR